MKTTGTHRDLSATLGALSMLGALCVQCGGPAGPAGSEAPPRRQHTSAPRCDGERYALTITPSLAAIQEQSNALAHVGGSLMIVESGANAVSSFDLESGRQEQNFIDVGNDKNPYDIAALPSSSLVAITNYFGPSVTIADASSGAMIAEIGQEHLISPSGVAATASHLYVTDVEFGRGEDGFGAGAVHVFERGTWRWVGELPTARKNPHYIVPDPGNPWVLFVADAGAVGIKQGRYRQLSEGAIERWVTSPAEPLAPQVTLALVPVAAEAALDATLARPMVTPDALYAVSATAPRISRLDLATMRWQPDGEPAAHELYRTDRDALHASAMMPDGVILVLSYNQDALYLFDTACDRVIDGPIDLGFRPQDLEGPLSVVVTSPTRAYFITSLSKRLGRIDLELL